MSDKEKPIQRGAREGPSAVDKWNNVVREAYAGDEAPADESDEEIERQLRAAGVDLDAEDAKADATYDAMVAKLAEHEPAADSGQVEHEPRSEGAWVSPAARPSFVVPTDRPSRAIWLAYAIAAAAATGGAAYVAANWAPHQEPPNQNPPAPPLPVPAPAPSAAPVPTPVAAPSAPLPSPPAPHPVRPDDKKGPK